MKISEYQTNRHAEAVRRREERGQAAYEAYKAALTGGGTFYQGRIK